MSLESTIAGLVAASNKLTDAVNGKMGQIDTKVNQAKSEFDAQLLSLTSKLPRLGITRNFAMEDKGNLGRPDSFGYHGEVSWTKVKNIVSFSQGAGRTAEEIALLAEIEADVREVYPDFNIRKYDFYRRDFNIWSGKWSAKGASPYFVYPLTSDSVLNSGTAAIPLNSFVTVGAFVRVLEGEVIGSWGSGSVKGKWRWCSYVIEPSKGFGTYTHLHPMRTSETGVIQMALVGACTGVVTHPDSWGGMLALG